jgi:LmbE family N-acetylglucosaminyl deacetylase
VVVSPHPDDETLGAGCLIAHQRLRGCRVTLIAVTDGEAAYPGHSRLRETRRAEQNAAMRSLGADPADIQRLGLPDGGLAGVEGAVFEKIAPLVDASTLVVAPWPLDPHPDHEVCGRAARRAAAEAGAELIFYFFWTWHRNTVEDLRDLPLYRFEADEVCRAARERALSAYQSQRDGVFGPPILPEELLKPARRTFETYLIDEEAS